MKEKESNKRETTAKSKVTPRTYIENMSWVDYGIALFLLSAYGIMVGFSSDLTGIKLVIHIVESLSRAVPVCIILTTLIVGGFYIMTSLWNKRKEIHAAELELAKAQAREQGMEQGVQQGKELGMQQGMQQGRELGSEVERKRWEKWYRESVPEELKSKIRTAPPQSESNDTRAN